MYLLVLFLGVDLVPVLLDDDVGDHRHAQAARLSGEIWSEVIGILQSRRSISSVTLVADPSLLGCRKGC